MPSQSECPYGPSKAAVDAGAERLDHFSAPWGKQAENWSRVVLIAAHNPELGMDRSVCLRDVVEFLRFGGAWTEDDPQPADLVEKHFRGGN